MLFTIHIVLAFIYLIISSRCFIFFIDITCFYGFITSITVSFNTISVKVSRIVLSIGSRPISILHTIIIIQHTNSCIRIIKVHRRVRICTDRNHKPTRKPNNHINHRKSYRLVKMISFFSCVLNDIITKSCKHSKSNQCSRMERQTEIIYKENFAFTEETHHNRKNPLENKSQNSQSNEVCNDKILPSERIFFSIINKTHRRDTKHHHHMNSNG